jgi:hypothetical protein
MKTTFLVLAALLFAACGSRRNNTEPLAAVQGNTVDVSFQSGRSALPVFYHEEALYLLGEEGIEYQICLKNQAPVRIEAVLSVDGRDVVSGRPADYRTDRGYVLEPREEICVAGFRESTESVAAFTFTQAGESYASKMGDGSNVGVIGIATFDETDGASRPLVIADGSEARMSQEPSPSAASEGAADKESNAIGTGYGQSVSSQAEIVPFVRRDLETPTELIAVYYDNRKGLEDRGIRISKDIDLSRRTPTPFPGVDSNTGFAPPPPR